MAGNIGGYVTSVPTIPPSAVVSGDVASGSLNAFTFASGVLTSGIYLGSGSIFGANASGPRIVASGTLGTFDHGSGTITSTLLASGILTSGIYLGSGSIYGANASGPRVIASGTLGTFDIGSGTVTSTLLASGILTSGVYIGSGSILGQAGGGPFNIASGSLGTYDHASGATVVRSQFSAPIYSGTSWNVLTTEAVSGIRAVAFNQSGLIQIAMAAVSGRMPAIGVVVDNVLSGIQANVYTQGLFSHAASGIFTCINYGAQPLWVGRSGQITPISGSHSSGGYASGDVGQKVGVATFTGVGSGALLISLNTTVWSGGPLGEATGGGVI